MKKSTPRKLSIALHTIRVLSGLELAAAGGGDGTLAPPQTNGSTASTCQGTRFNCCLLTP